MAPNIFRICTECKKPVSEEQVNVIHVPERDIAQNYCSECFKSVDFDKILENEKKKNKNRT